MKENSEIWNEALKAWKKQKRSEYEIMEKLRSQKEKTFTLTKAIRFKDGKPVRETVTIKESELTQQQLDFLTGELMLKWQDSPKEVQRRFINRSRLSMKEVLNYEVLSHWLAGWIWFEWGHRLMGSYIARKVSRKYKRYSWNMDMKERVKK